MSKRSRIGAVHIRGMDVKVARFRIAERWPTWGDLFP
jgi:hypothetical protein